METRLVSLRRDRVSLSEAAQIVGRSYSWVRDRTIDGSLPYVLDGRRLFVATAHLASFTPRRPAPVRPTLRLVVDNTI